MHAQPHSSLMFSPPTMERIRNICAQTNVKLRQFTNSFVAEQPTARAVAYASAVFLGTFALLYMLGVSLFVALKWESTMQQQHETFLLPTHLPLEQASLVRLLESDADATHRQLDGRLQQLQELLRQHNDVYQESQNHIASLQSKIEQASDPLDIPKVMSRASAGDLTQRTPHLLMLLQSLPDKLEKTYPTLADLENGLELAKHDIYELMEDDTTPWDKVTDWLQNPYWRSLKWNNFEGSRYCSASSATGNIDIVMSPEDQAFVKELVQEVRYFLEQRDKDPDDNGWKATLDQTIDLLDDTYKKNVAIASSRLKYLGSKYKRSLKKKSSLTIESVVTTDTCPVTNETIVAMVEAGLDALYRKQDIRRAVGVMASTSAQQHNESSLILGAVLDEPWKPPRALYSESVNLRRVIDKPILKLAAKWIDNGLDLVGGHSDFIDSKVDSFTGGRDEFGSICIEYLLRQSGKVDMPVPLKLQTKKMAEQTTRL
ncbi:hypothetical protein MPSEU_000807500 [Mayamaea pseudoterrestris]|nr:hypothetical protein MPSEU_000807500 [Mayamaea pseudoterrestris]